MNFIALSPVDIAIAAMLLILNAALSIFLRLRLEKQMLVAAAPSFAELGALSAGGQLQLMATTEFVADLEPPTALVRVGDQPSELACISSSEPTVVAEFISILCMAFSAPRSTARAMNCFTSGLDIADETLR